VIEGEGIKYCNGFPQSIDRQRLYKHHAIRALNDRTNVIDRCYAAVSAPMTWLGGGHVICFLWVQTVSQWTGEIANTWHVFSVRGLGRGVILKTFGATTQLTEFDWKFEVSHGKFVVEDKLEVGLWRRNEWFEDFTCAVAQWFWECVKWEIPV
jgi:hypothetical protein